MSTSETVSHDEAIGQFCGVTGADEERARGLLEACEWNLELAINMHVDTDPEGRSSASRKAQQQQQQSTSSSASMSAGAAAIASAASSVSNANFRNNASVQIDDDDDDEDMMSDTRGGRFAVRHDRASNPAIRRFGAGTSSAAEAAASADAAFAAANYFQTDSDGVRPPIAPVRQILNPNPIGYPAPEMPQRARRTGPYNTRTGPISEVYDAFRDFQAEAQWQEMAQEGESTAAGSDNGRRHTTLQELFRPPLELMFRGPFETARESGTTQNRWLLVNIHSGREFACQILNRDVWSNQTVKDIIKEHFIFWQVYHDSYEGQRYVQFYHVKKLPHVAIIDPRTGELMKSWPTSIDHNSFCDSVIEFLTEHPSPDGSTDANTMKKLRVKEDRGVEQDDDDDEPEIIPTRATLYDQSEEAQLEAAIKASLRETEKVDRIDDTIEIDEDTIEALDIMEPQQTASDKAVAGRASSDNNSKPKNDSFQPESQIQSSAKTFAPSTSSHKQPSKANYKSVNIKDESGTTAAEALKAVADKKPTKIEGPECRIALRFPDGSSLVQKFAANEQLESVKDFVQMGKSTFRSSKIEFVAPPNRKLNESMMNETLEGLGLCPASRLEVKFALE